MKTTEPPVIAEQLFSASKEAVWSAITEHQQMTEWYFDNLPDFKAEVGFTTQFNVKAPSRDFLHIWRVTEVLPMKKIAYNWTFKDCEGSGETIFELFEQGSKTLLRLTNVVIEDFDDTIPEFKRESCKAGWNYFINERLVAYLSQETSNL
ncbi:SRPBCC domain-containing protein [Mariniflexile aquimaris]|uniref:SRPBCC domain-containing protein n=1 Tax=Mariniflexile aquimaris TaxID=881009 RepID=A0ABW3BSV0_9FLAO